ncbi:uncharacterized protein TNCV_1069041 [Trichonephila clavipes]|nr:uncharacterized protein TNCV_1069041 [Trichonephila clavipes]
MDVSKYIVLSRHGDTLNSCQAESPPMKLVEKEERREASDHYQGVPLQNWDGTETNRTITCLVLKTKANDSRKNLTLCRDEFRRPSSDVTVDQVA